MPWTAPPRRGRSRWACRDVRRRGHCGGRAAWCALPLFLGVVGYRLYRDGPDPTVRMTEPPSALPTLKARLRAELERARGAIDPVERARASGGAARNLLTLPELAPAGAVLLYAATSSEIDPGPIRDELLGRDVRVLLPRVAGETLEVVPVTGAEYLATGPRGVPEPAGQAVDPTGVDVAVVPGVGFDRGGGRLGRGGGHYDRLLAGMPASTLRVGLCFAVQVVDRVPRAGHDVPVDVVVTEREVIRAGAGS